MSKKIVIGLIILLTVICCGCEKKPVEELDKRVYLTNKYYNNGDYLDVTSEDLLELENEIYVLYTYNPYCTFEISCDEIFEIFMKKYKIDFLSIPFSEFKETKFYNEVKYGPSVLIVNRGEILTYLDANSNFDLEKYQKASAFETWIKKYIIVINQ